MNLQVILVNAIAALLILFILWWFFWSKQQSTTASANQPITIVVKNGLYQPAFINVPANKEIHLRFLREDGSPCAGNVLFPQLNFSYQLPLNQITDVILPPQKPGEIDFTCPMNMYKGKLMIV